MQKAIRSLADKYLDCRHQIWASAAAAEPATAIADPRELAASLEQSVASTAHHVCLHISAPKMVMQDCVS